MRHTPAPGPHAAAVKKGLEKLRPQIQAIRVSIDNLLKQLEQNTPLDTVPMRINEGASLPPSEHLRRSEISLKEIADRASSLGRGSSVSGQSA